MKIDNPMTGFSSAIDLSRYKQSTINQDVKNKLNELAQSSAEKVEPSLNVKTSVALVDNSKRLERTIQISSEQSKKYIYVPHRDSADAMVDMDRQFSGIKMEIDKARPDLQRVSWDFVLQDGKFNVVSSKLNASDKSWIESKLNGNSQLLTAANKYKQAVVTYYQDEPDRTESIIGTIEEARGGNGIGAYENVAKDIEGKITFRDLLETGMILGKTGYGNTPKIPPLDYARGLLTKGVVTGFSSRLSRLLDEFA